MALIHRATLRPTKIELLAEWLPTRDWFTGSAEAMERVAAYRFDDPADTVGIETMLVRAGGDATGPVWQVPLTYRDAPLDGGDRWLLGTAEHSTLGRRWIYDGTGDPVYAAALASAILGNTGQADEFMQTDNGLVPRELTMDIASTATTAATTAVPTVGAVLRVVDGDPTVVTADTVELTVHRRLDATRPGAGLTGTWPGQSTPVPLATATLR
jgi:hypothetical protein